MVSSKTDIAMMLQYIPVTHKATHLHKTTTTTPRPPFSSLLLSHTLLLLKTWKHNGETSLNRNPSTGQPLSSPTPPLSPIRLKNYIIKTTTPSKLHLSVQNLV